MSKRFANSDKGGENLGWRVGLSGASSRLAYGLGWCLCIALGKAGLAARCHEEEVRMCGTPSKFAKGHVSSSSISVRVNLPSPHHTFLDAWAPQLGSVSCLGTSRLLA